MSSRSSNVIAALRARGFVQQVNDEAGLSVHLRGADPVVFYAGFDPTGPSLHLGHVLPLMAMAHLVRAGHRAIAVLGGGTALIGDPSGKSEMRPLLSTDAVRENCRRIETQIRGFLEGAASGQSMVTVVDNAEWLQSLNHLDFLRDIGRHFSVNRMLAAEAYRQRLEKGLSFIEFNYQILQAYDFLVLFRRYGCTLQVGGDDQWGNILAGTDLIRRLDRAEVYALTFPLVTTASGAKMGKTAAGALWLAPDLTSPFDFYQYFINLDDRDVEAFLKLFTFRDLDEVARLAALEGAELREAKQALAFDTTALVHGRQAAESARGAARDAFRDGGGASDSVPTHLVTPEALASGPKIVDVLAAAGLATSKSAARRLVAQGGVQLGKRRVTSIEDVLRPEDVPPEGTLLRAGKKHLRRIVVGGA